MSKVLVALEMISCSGLGLMDFNVPPLAQAGDQHVPHFHGLGVPCGPGPRRWTCMDKRHCTAW